MSDQNKIYEEVAINCSQYCPCGRDHSVKNVSNGDDAKDVYKRQVFFHDIIAAGKSAMKENVKAAMKVFASSILD